MLKIETTNQLKGWIEDKRLGDLRCKKFKYHYDTALRWYEQGVVVDSIHKLDKAVEECRKPLELVQCVYPFCLYPCVWVSSIGTMISYVKVLGLDAPLSEVPYLLTDITGR